MFVIISSGAVTAYFLDVPMTCHSQHPRVGTHYTLPVFTAVFTGREHGCPGVQHGCHFGHLYIRTVVRARIHGQCVPSTYVDGP